MYILKSYTNPIPANYFYTQTDGIHHKFPASPVIEDLARSVSAFRIANKLPRSSILESLQDIDVFTCQRLQNSGVYCFNAQNSFEENRANHPMFKKGCPTCGTPIKKT